VSLSRLEDKPIPRVTGGGELASKFIRYTAFSAGARFGTTNDAPVSAGASGGRYEAGRSEPIEVLRARPQSGQVHVHVWADSGVAVTVPRCSMRGEPVVGGGQPRPAVRRDGSVEVSQ
jgi:hypothetical protein